MVTRPRNDFTPDFDKKKTRHAGGFVLVIG